jgi:hypothetical protein
LRQWGDEFVAQQPAMTLLHKGHELHGRWYCETCGEPVRDRDLVRQVNIPGWDLAGPLKDAGDAK